MTDFRSESEKFVTQFLDYVYKYDILDEFNKRTQKMERSAGIQKLIEAAEAVFPERKTGKTDLSDEAVTKAIEASSEVVLDRRDVFARKIAANGGARGLLEAVLKGDEAARDLAEDFIRAEYGEKEFESV